MWDAAQCACYKDESDVPGVVEQWVGQWFSIKPQKLCKVDGRRPLDDIAAGSTGKMIASILIHFIYLVSCVLQCSIKQRHYKAREDKKRLAAMTEEEVAKQIEESEKHAGLSLSVAAAASLTVCMIDFPFDTKAFQWLRNELYISHSVDFCKKLEAAVQTGH